MSECDSLTAIVADMRSDAEAYHDAWLNDPNESPESDAVSNVLANYARRIEAAWKREKAEWKARGVNKYIGGGEEVSDATQKRPASRGPRCARLDERGECAFAGGRCIDGSMNVAKSAAPFYCNFFKRKRKPRKGASR